jgi:hypothetical protein
MDWAIQRLGPQILPFIPKGDREHYVPGKVLLWDLKD